MTQVIRRPAEANGGPAAEVSLESATLGGAVVKSLAHYLDHLQEPDVSHSIQHEGQWRDMRACAWMALDAASALQKLGVDITPETQFFPNDPRCQVLSHSALWHAVHFCLGETAEPGTVKDAERVAAEFLHAKIVHTRVPTEYPAPTWMTPEAYQPILPGPIMGTRAPL